MDELGQQTRDDAEQPRIGRLIVLEGLNEVGKTTVSHALARLLNERGGTSEVQAFPGRSPGSLGHHIYRLHHAPLKFGIEEISPTALQALHVAAHLDAIERAILPKLVSGVDVILDRYWWSTMTYGIATGVSEHLLESLIATELIAWHGQQPAIVVVLERKVAIPQRERVDFFNTLREQYRKLVCAADRHHPAYIIDNDGTVEQTTTKIASLLRA
ncbi:dTMP kinase [Bosea sp. (in: a-proteobacteria)]|jgi:thymidylate kinase|uniref:dTMP kinase n=1 Tax=Bosea sp. (in: a-proteobacteria) TaxID=1871050 RepID=UPI003563C01A